MEVQNVILPSKNRTKDLLVLATKFCSVIVMLFKWTMLGWASCFFCKRLFCDRIMTFCDLRRIGLSWKLLLNDQRYRDWKMEVYRCIIGHLEPSLKLCLICLFCFTGCLGFTKYSEIGDDVCLHFSKNTSFSIYAIKFSGIAICASSDGNNTHKFQDRYANCNISGTIMTVCFGNFQLNDTGTYSLHDGLPPSSKLLNSITLEKASKETMFQSYCFKL